MKIAISGATGFLGHYLLDRLHRDHELQCWTRQEQPCIHESVKWIRGQLNDADSTEELVEGCDALVHSGLWRTTESFRGQESNLVDYLQTNLIGSIRLFEAARKAGLKKVVFVSTCAVHEKILEDRPLDESHPTWALSHYGAHKAAIERFVHSLGWGEGFPICAIRPTGIYGLHSHPEKSKWFELISRIKRGEDVEVTGGGKEVHVADVAKAIEILLLSDQIAGEVFNCYDRYVSKYEVANLAKQISGSSSQIVGQPREPRNQIETGKLKALGMQFGGQTLLKQTIEKLLAVEPPA